MKAEQVAAGACPCGGQYVVVRKLGADDDGMMHVMHKKPPCAEFKELGGERFLHWVRTGEKPKEVPKPNRKARRKMLRAQRRKRR